MEWETVDFAAALAIAVMAGFILQTAESAYAASGDSSMNLGAGMLKHYSNTDEAQMNI